MDSNRYLLTVELDGTRYRGAYSLDENHLVVEAHGLGRTEIDAALVDHSLGEPAKKLATIVFTQLIKENVEREPSTLELVAQGTTTQVTFLGAPG